MKISISNLLNNSYMSKKETAYYVILLNVAFISPAYAYIGPGMGLGAAFGIIALLVGVVALIFALVWFPIKRRFFNKNKTIIKKKR